MQFKVRFYFSIVAAGVLLLSSAQVAESQSGESQMSEGRKLAQPISLQNHNGNDGIAFLKSGDFKHAAEYFASELKQNRRNIDALNNYAVSLVGLKQYDQALKIYSNAIAVDSKRAMLFINRADLYVLLHLYNNAMDDYTHAIELEPANIRAYDARARTENITGSYEKAVADYTRLIELDQQKAAIYFDNRSYAYKCMGKQENALQDINKAISLAPNISELYLDRALILQQSKKYDLALADYNRLLKADLPSRKVLLNRAICYLQMQQYGKCLVDCDNVASLKPDTNESSSLLAISAAAMNGLKDFHKALDYAGKAIKIDPSCPIAYLERAIALTHLQNFPDALKDCDTVISMDANAQEALLCKADILERLAICNKALAQKSRSIFD